MINKKMKVFLKYSIEQKFSEIYGDNQFENQLETSLKDDQSVVTQIDIFISDLIKNEMKNHKELANLSFYSEEDMESFSFPCLVLDPIDGTKALTTGVPECCVSLAIIDENAEKCYGWLYNPFNGFEVASDDQFVMAPNYIFDGPYIGMVSRSDYKRGIFNDSPKNKTVIYPKGSIAYKLGLLAVGACDFVISKTPKNIWDIAAGTIILETRGYKMYQEGKEMKSLDIVHIKGDLIWCRPELIEIIRKDLVN